MRVPSRACVDPIYTQPKEKNVEVGTRPLNIAHQHRRKRTKLQMSTGNKAIMVPIQVTELKIATFSKYVSVLSLSPAGTFLLLSNVTVILIGLKALLVRPYSLHHAMRFRHHRLASSRVAVKDKRYAVCFYCSCMV